MSVFVYIVHVYTYIRHLLVVCFPPYFCCSSFVCLYRLKFYKRTTLLALWLWHSLEQLSLKCVTL